VAYEVGGKRFDHYPWHQSDLHDAVPVYEDLPGWQTDTTGATRIGELPREAQEYVAFLAHQAGVPVTVVGVGPGRDQFVRVGSPAAPQTV
jgi:adenylosuccinate synthase